MLDWKDLIVAVVCLVLGWLARHVSGSFSMVRHSRSDVEIKGKSNNSSANTGQNPPPENPGQAKPPTF